MRQKDGVISEAIYYARRSHHPRAPTKQMLLYSISQRKAITLRIVGGGAPTYYCATFLSKTT